MQNQIYPRKKMLRNIPLASFPLILLITLQIIHFTHSTFRSLKVLSTNSGNRVDIPLFLRILEK